MCRLDSTAEYQINQIKSLNCPGTGACPYIKWRPGLHEWTFPILYILWRYIHKTWSISKGAYIQVYEKHPKKKCMRNWLLHTHAFICSRPPTEIQDRSKKNFQAKQCMVPWRLGFAVATILSFTGCTIYCSCFYSIQWSTTSHASPVKHCSRRFLHSRIVQNLCLSTWFVCSFQVPRNAGMNIYRTMMHGQVIN